MLAFFSPTVTFDLGVSHERADSLQSRPPVIRFLESPFAVAKYFPFFIAVYFRLSSQRKGSRPNIFNPVLRCGEPQRRSHRCTSFLPFITVLIFPLSIMKVSMWVLVIFSTVLFKNLLVDFFLLPCSFPNCLLLMPPGTRNWTFATLSLFSMPFPFPNRPPLVLPPLFFPRVYVSFPLFSGVYQKSLG